eukprot:6694351-Alexandrium_andersonii.AAC.1
MDVATFFGICRITPKDSAFQISCTHPDHNLVGQAKGTKTRATTFDGGEEMALRMLKWWAVLGAGAANKADHSQLWAD